MRVAFLRLSVRVCARGLFLPGEEECARWRIEHGRLSQLTRSWVTLVGGALPLLLLSDVRASTGPSALFFHRHHGRTDGGDSSLGRQRHRRAGVEGRRGRVEGVSVAEKGRCVWWCSEKKGVWWRRRNVPRARVKSFMTRVGRREGRVGRFARCLQVSLPPQLSFPSVLLETTTTTTTSTRETPSSPRPGRVAKRPGVKRDKRAVDTGRKFRPAVTGASVCELEDPSTHSQNVIAL